MNKNKSILNNTGILFFLLFLIYRPEFILKFEILDSVINILRVLAAIFIFALYVYNNRVTKTMLWIITIWGSFNILCLINKSWSFNVLIELSLIISIAILVELYYNTYYRVMNSAIHSLLFLYAICNTITILAGLDVGNLFLGFDNDIPMRIIPLIGVMFFFSLKTNGRLKKGDWVIYLIYLLNFIITWSVSAIIGLLFLSLLLLKGKWKCLITSKKSIALSILIWTLLYVFKIQNALSYLFNSILHKDITLSYRMYIWESVLIAIKQKPILGYGNIMNNEIYYNIVRPMYYASVAPHNFWLYICASGGIVGIILIIFFIVRCFKYVDSHISEFSNQVLTITLLAYLITGIFASYYGIEYLAFLLVTANKKKFDK